MKRDAQEFMQYVYYVMTDSLLRLNTAKTACIRFRRRKGHENEKFYFITRNTKILESDEITLLEITLSYDHSIRTYICDL